MHTTRIVTVGLSILIALGALAQPASQLTSQPTSEPIPRDVLQKMFQRELGENYHQADAPKLFIGHALLERFFSASTAAERKAIIQSLEQTAIDPNILGRLARIRADWPNLVGGGVYYINERVGPHDVHYFLGVPKNYDRSQPSPLLVKLPTADAFVGQPPATADDVQRIYTGWMQDELKRHPDAICIMPLLNLSERWGPSYAGMNSVIQPILHVAGRANVDPTRVFLIGHSMSAHGVWNLALHYPTYLAAINPLAGGASNDWQRLRMMNLRNVFPVVWHDADDKVIRPNSSGQLISVLKRLKIPYDFVETRGIGHTPTDQIVEQCYGKLRGVTRNLYPPLVSLQSNRPDTMFNRIDWLQVYQPLRSGDEKRLIFKGTVGYMIVYANTFTAQASFGEPGSNHFEISSENVQTLRLYVNDQMIDFSKPVTVTVNRKQRLEGLVKPSVTEMLNDQLFLGRGWRYFSGVIDIDLASEPATRAATRSTRH